MGDPIFVVTIGRLSHGPSTGGTPFCHLDGLQLLLRETRSPRRLPILFLGGKKGGSPLPKMQKVGFFAARKKYGKSLFI